jgi:autoinducer 2 (AI-2) kinase
MAGRFVCALDAGGGGAGALLLDLDSGATWTAHRRWRHPVAPGTDGWGFDFDWRLAWRSFGAAMREVLVASETRPGEVIAVAATGMRHGMVLVGPEGELWAATNKDARAASEATELAAQMGPALYEATGHWPAPMLPLARLRHLAANEPALLGEARAVLSVSDWLSWRLSGQLVAEPSQAGATGLLSLEASAWDGIVARTGVDPRLLPPLRMPGSVCGQLTAGAAAHLGLTPGIPVAVGGADTQCALLGCGAVEPGHAVIVAGTTMPIQLVSGEALVDPERRLWTGRHLLPGRFMLEANAGAAGEALDLLGKLVYPGDPLAVARLAAEAAAAPPGAAGVLSDIGVTVFNAGQLGLPVGALTLSTLSEELAESPRPYLARAVLEGIAYGVRANLAELERVSGAITHTIALCGGLSRSAAWCQLLTEVLGRPIQRAKVPEASLLGAAICAAAGAEGSPVAGVAERFSQPDRTYDPSAAGHSVYEDFYEAWQRHRETRSAADELAAEGILRWSGPEDIEAHAAAPTRGTRPSILVTAPLGEDALDQLRDLAEVRYEPYMEAQRVLTGEDLVEALAGVDIFVTEVDLIDAAALDSLPSLRAIFTCRADPVNVDVAACTAHGVPVMNAPGRNARSVAELTLAFILSLTRKAVAADRFLHDPATAAGDIARMGMAHAEFEGRELRGVTVGLAGFGQVGRQVAAVLRPLGAIVIASDPFAAPVRALAEGVEVVSFEELLRRADVISLHAPVTEATRGMFGAAQFAAMKPGALFVNTARAALADEEALAAALRSGHLGGAALDVFAEEPPGHDHPLLAFPNVMATPHIGGNTVDVAVRQGELVCRAVEDLLAGRAPDTLLNPTAMEAFGWEGPRRAPTAAELERLSEGAGPAVTDLEREARPPRAPVPASPKPAAKPAGAVSHLTAVPSSDEVERRGFRRLVARLRRTPSAERAGPGAPIEAISAPLSKAARGAWEALFAEFVARLPGDDAVRRFSASKNVMVRYHVTDVDVVFHTGFIGDPPQAGMGEPPVTPHLTLRMTSAVLDDVFMERISGMKAAMSGRMAFSGNTMRAMALQRVQRDLNRVYRTAREATGEPPPIAAAPVSPPSVASHRSAAPTANGQQPTAVAGDERDGMLALVNELFAAHLLTSTGGNVSIRRPGHPDEAWITPSQLPKGHLSADMLVRIGMDGEPLDPGSLAPSSERLMHTALYRARPEVEAVVHSHGPKAFALGLAGLPFLPVSTEAAFFGDLPRVPFTMPGTDELAEAAVGAMGRGFGVLLVNHGLLVGASSLRRAVDMTAVIEETAGALLDCHAAGREPPVLPEDVVAQLREVGEMMG